LLQILQKVDEQLFCNLKLLFALKPKQMICIFGRSMTPAVKIDFLPEETNFYLKQVQLLD